MLKLADIILSTEKSFKNLLESFFLTVYPRENLPSHNIDHHRRVWEYAKELLKYKEKDGFCFDRPFIQKLIIGCFLHDIGMAIDPGERHGRHSRELCVRFLKENNMNESEYSDLLAAVENHDDKEYAAAGNKDLLLTLLSVADDLDAFGEEGIERYLEIYRERGVDEKKIGQAICDNAEKRFRNFENLFLKYPELLEKHRIRYVELIDHFKKNIVLNKA